MDKTSAADSSADLSILLDRLVTSRRPIRIKGEHGNAVLVSEEEWSSIQETLYLLSVPGMRQSIREGLETPVAECDDELE